jgi:hypothetical protein
LYTTTTYLALACPAVLQQVLELTAVRGLGALAFLVEPFEDLVAVYEIESPIKTPSGKTVRFCSIWQIDAGTDVPRFITMYPR